MIKESETLSEQSTVRRALQLLEESQDSSPTEPTKALSQDQKILLLQKVSERLLAGSAQGRAADG